MSQSLNNIVVVNVTSAPSGATPNGFNLGLIVGSSTIIPTTTRTVFYSNLQAMAQAGFSSSNPEYEAATLYFAQSPTPQGVVIGRQDLTVPETLVEAVTACRTSNSQWYGVYACGATDTDIEAISAFVQSASPVGVYFYDTSEANVLSGTTPNVMATLYGTKPTRTIGLWSATQYAGAALMGVTMGLQTGLPNSAFTLDYKTLVGVQPDVFTPAQYDQIAAYNGNSYTTFGNAFTLLTKGVMADGSSYDSLLNTDVLSQDIQTAVISLLTSVPKIPQTDAGVTAIVNEVAVVCRSAQVEGILAPGVWTGAPVLTIQTGQALPEGFAVVADTIASQTSTQITNRQAPPIYACVLMAGAIQSVAISVITSY